MAKILENVEHGTSKAYKRGCRCNPCYEAGSRWMREYYRDTDRLTKMFRTGEPMQKGSRGGLGSRGPQENLSVRRTKHSSTKNSGRKKPEVVEYDDAD